MRVAIREYFVSKILHNNQLSDWLKQKYALNDGSCQNLEAVAKWATRNVISIVLEVTCDAIDNMGKAHSVQMNRRIWIPVAPVI